MTLTEMVLALVLIAGVLGGLQMLSASLRADSADEQTRRTLRTLRAAAILHHHLAQRGEANAASVAALRTGPTDAALAALLAHPRTAAILAPVETAFTRTADGRLIARDGYGRAIRYLPPPPSRPDQPADAYHDTPGDFVSCGPDGRFGDPPASDPAGYTPGTADNLYGSDLEFQP